eukprot:scaffold75026_cov59-Attheya_sp.AAC.1
MIIHDPVFHPASLDHRATVLLGKRWNYLEPRTHRNPVGSSTDAQKEKPQNSDFCTFLPSSHMSCLDI